MELRNPFARASQSSSLERSSRMTQEQGNSDSLASNEARSSPQSQCLHEPPNTQGTREFQNSQEFQGPHNIRSQKSCQIEDPQKCHEKSQDFHKSRELQEFQGPQNIRSQELQQNQEIPKCQESQKSEEFQNSQEFKEPQGSQGREPHHRRSHTPETTGAGRNINIPRDSFTAFRLLYGTVQQISHLSCTVFLGPVPDAWMDTTRTSVLLKSKKSAKSSVRNWVKSSTARVKASVRADSHLVPPGEGPSDPLSKALLDGPFGGDCSGRTSDASSQSCSSVSSNEYVLDEKTGGDSDGETDGGLDGETDAVMDGATDGGLDGATDGGLDGATDGGMHGADDGGVDRAADVAINGHSKNGTGQSLNVENSPGHSPNSNSDNVFSGRDDGGPCARHLRGFTSGASCDSSGSSLVRYLPRHISEESVDSSRAPPFDKSHDRSQDCLHPNWNALQADATQDCEDRGISHGRDSLSASGLYKDASESSTSLKTAAESSQLIWADLTNNDSESRDVPSDAPYGVHDSQPPMIHIRRCSSFGDASHPASSRVFETQSAVSVTQTHGTVSRKTTRTRVTFAEPAPETQDVADALEKEYVRAEKKHKRHMQKLHSFAGKASRSKNSAVLKKNRLKLHVMHSLLRKHGKGDILRVDRMLVLVKKATSVHTLSTLSEHKNVDFGIVDHWREYHVVLKKTASDTAPLLVQFFEVKKAKDFNTKPDHKLRIRKELMCDFYCHSDKSICIADPGDDGVRLFIMNTRFISVAYKWLYMIKEILEEDFFSMLSIEVAGSGIQFQINIPRPILQEVFTTSASMHILEKKHGYDVVRDPLLEYVKEQMTRRIRAISSGHAPLRHWMATNAQPWFCFKFYDRVEWLANSGRSLFVQSQLLRGQASLELRSMETTPLSCERKRGPSQHPLSNQPSSNQPSSNQPSSDQPSSDQPSSDQPPLRRPYPVEGFLSRITNIKGDEHSGIRPFYRIQYFHSADNILFFSKFFRGVPPSPGNVLLQADASSVQERTQLGTQIPPVYVKNCFELDANNHIPWLDSPQFKAFDTLAVEEFSRKIQHLACAEAMIDLCNVKEIRDVPRRQIARHHLCLQSYLWYSSPSLLEDDELMDCGFEMELVNGSTVKLLAPSRAIKLEWITRLSELSAYWNCHAEKLVQSQMATKLANAAKLLVGDSVDSNVDFAPHSIEAGSSVANSHLFTNASMAMSTPVLAAGPVYHKQKKHASFVQCYMVLCPGFVNIFSLHRRSKVSGLWKKTPYYERYMTIPITECYVHAEANAQLDLLDTSAGKAPGDDAVPRVYPDGWKSSETDAMRSFSVWFGGKRTLRRGLVNTPGAKNPSFIHMARKAGFTGKTLVFQARSRQEREMWVYNILQEINRRAG